MLKIFLSFFLVIVPALSMDFNERILDLASEVKSQRGTALLLKNVARDHTGKNLSKSYFYFDDQATILNVFEEVIKCPTGYVCDQSLMLVRAFTEEEAKKLTGKKIMGVDLFNSPQSVDETKRVAVCFKSKKGKMIDILNKGKPWDVLGMDIGLLTGYPIRESLQVSNF